MQRKFEEFVRSLSASEERISNVHAMADNLISRDHAEQRLIKTKCNEVDHMWNETRELAQARLEVSSLAVVLHLLMII